MPRRVLEGEVVSNKTDKTITVLVERRYRHPVYKKYIKRTDKYAAHDENNQFVIGDRVSIIECRPISKTKTWTVVTGDEPSASAKPVKKVEEKKPEAKKAASKKAAPKPKKAASKTASKKEVAKKPAAKKAAAAKSEKKDK